MAFKIIPRIQIYIHTFLLFLYSFTATGQSWVKKFISPNSTIAGEAVLPYNGDFFVSCHAYDTIDLSYASTILSRIDSQGNPLWTKKFVFSNVPFRASVGLINTIDGNLVFLLSYGAYTGVMKTDTAGNFLWGKRFAMAPGTSYKIEETNKGNIVLAGVNDHGSPTFNGFIIWLDKNGNMTHYYDFVSPFSWNAQLHLSDIIKTSDGGCVATGWINKNWPSNNTLLLKLDSTGAVSWTKCIGDGGSQSGTSITEITNGFVYAGRNGNDLLLGRIDNNGNSVWNKTFRQLFAGWPRVKVTTKGIEIITLTSKDSLYYYPLKFAILNTDLSGNFISGNLLPDPYYSSWLKFAVAAYPQNKSRIILRQEHEKGFKLIKNDNLNRLSSCADTIAPTSVISNIFQNSFVGCTISSTIPVDSFSAISYPYILQTERACSCEPLHLTHELIGCKDEKLILTSSNANSHLWNTGETDSSIYVTQPSTYWVQNLFSCTLSDTFKVSYANPQANFISDKDRLNINEDMVLMNTSSNAFSYKWDFGDGKESNEKDPLHNWEYAGDYWIKLIASDRTCSDTSLLKIIVNELIIPNIFTPNNDGINDAFIIKGEGLDNLICSIFDRWGNKIYEFMDHKKGWDGKGYNDGTYYYVIDIADGKKNHKALTGVITLLR